MSVYENVENEWLAMSSFNKTENRKISTILGTIYFSSLL